MGNSNNRLVIPPKRYEQIEKEVVKLFLELGLSIPIKPKEVAQSLGYVVRTYSELEVDRKTLSKLREECDGNHKDGLSYYDPNIHTFVILVNDIDSFTEEHDEFTIMHEIGHIKLGHKGDSQLAEMEANCFAAYALVPSPIANMYGCESASEIVKVFGVSLPCAKICWERYEKWVKYSGPVKPYEKELMEFLRRM